MDQRVFEMSELQKSDRKIGTEIFDFSLPSDLNLSPTKPVSKPNFKPSPAESIASLNKQFRQYTVKGAPILQLKQKYFPNDVFKNTLYSFEVKSFDNESSQTLLKLWDKVRGYCKRLLCLQDGFLYIIEIKSKVPFVNSIFSLSDLFKIFIDPQEMSLRLVFRQHHHLITQNFQIQKLAQFVEKLFLQISTVGLTLYG